MSRIRRTGEWFIALALTAVVAACSSTEPTHTNPTVTPPFTDWLPKAPMPMARFLAGSAVANGRLYVVGGRSSDYPTYANAMSAGSVVFESYDPASDTWTSLPDMPSPREDLSAASVNGIVYAMGGSGMDTITGPFIGELDRVEAYDPSSNSWTRKAPMPEARMQHATAVVNGVIYIVGGWSHAGFDGRVYAYDPATDTYTPKAPMPHPRGSMGVGVVGGVVYAIGGLDHSEKIFDLVEAYDPATNSWSTKAPLPIRLYGLAVSVVNGILYAVGGAGPVPGDSLDTGYYTATVEAYDPATDSWTTKSPMSIPRYFLNVENIGGHLFAVGGGITDVTGGHGADPDTPYNLVEEYTP